MAVDVDGQRVARQHYDPADTTCGDVRELHFLRVRFKGGAADSPFLPLVEELLNFFHASTDVFHFGSWKNRKRQKTK